MGESIDNYTENDVHPNDDDYNEKGNVEDKSHAELVGFIWMWLDQRVSDTAAGPESEVEYEYETSKRALANREIVVLEH